MDLLKQDGRLQGFKQVLLIGFGSNKLPHANKLKNSQTKIQKMLLYTICCHASNNYIYEGTKFNMQKEEVQEEAYLENITVYQIYLK